MGWEKGGAFRDLFPVFYFAPLSYGAEQGCPIAGVGGGPCPKVGKGVMMSHLGRGMIFHCEIRGMMSHSGIKGG